VRNGGPLEAPRRPMLCRSRTLTAKASRKRAGASAGARDQGRHGGAREPVPLSSSGNNVVGQRRLAALAAHQPIERPRVGALARFGKNAALFMAASFSANRRRHELIDADAVFLRPYFFPRLRGEGRREGPARDCTAPAGGKEACPLPSCTVNSFTNSEAGIQSRRGGACTPGLRFRGGDEREAAGVVRMVGTTKIPASTVGRDDRRSKPMSRMAPPAGPRVLRYAVAHSDWRAVSITLDATEPTRLPTARDFR